MGIDLTHLREPTAAVGPRFSLGLVRYDANTGELLETVTFLPKSADPHGLVMHNGSLNSCDAGIHPGWKTNDSPTTGYIFRIDFI